MAVVTPDPLFANQQKRKKPTPVDTSQSSPQALLATSAGAAAPFSNGNLFQQAPIRRRRVYSETSQGSPLTLTGDYVQLAAAVIESLPRPVRKRQTLDDTSQSTPPVLYALVAGSHDATGALQASAATIAGTAAHEHAATGALTASAATIAGTTAHQHVAAGAMVADAATIAGTAAHTAPGAHASSGALQADAAAIAGTAAHLTLHASSGALQADAAGIAGTATHIAVHATSGALVADAAAIAGVAFHGLPGAHIGIGALQADAASISGQAASQRYLQPPPAAVHGYNQQPGGTTRKKPKGLATHQTDAEVLAAELAALRAAEDLKADNERIAELLAAVMIEFYGGP